MLRVSNAAVRGANLASHCVTLQLMAANCKLMKSVSSSHAKASCVECNRIYKAFGENEHLFVEYKGEMSLSSCFILSERNPERSLKEVEEQRK